MNKLILIKTNVNMKNQLKLEWMERYYQLVSAEQFCQIYLKIL